MNEVSPYQFLRLSEAHGNNNDFTQAIFRDAKILAQKRLPVIFTLNHLAKLTGSSYRFLHSVVERKYDPYFHFTILKRNGTRRAISAPRPILFNALNFIKEKILDSDYILNFMDDAVFSFRKKRSIVDNAKIHIGASWLIKIDIVDFFGAIKEISVFNFFSSLGYAALLSFEMARLVTWPQLNLYSTTILSSTSYHKYKFYSGDLNNHGSLPQGAPTSPQLSNIIFKPVDIILNYVSKKYGCVYTRYADDLFFSSNKLDKRSIKLIIQEVRSNLSRFGYELNQSKTKVFSPGSKKIVTGIIVTDNTLRLNKKFKDEIKKHIFFIEKNGLQEQAHHSGSKNAISFLAYLRGKLNFARQVEPNFALKWALRLDRIIQQSRIINKKFY